MDVSLLFTTALGLGLIMAFVPGAVFCEALPLGFRKGFRPVLSLELGASAGDAIWAIIALVGLAFLVQDPLTKLGLGLMGSAFLGYLAYKMLTEHRKCLPDDENVESTRNAFITGAVISFASPFQIAFWLGIGASTILVLVSEPQPIHYVLFFVAYMIGSCLGGTIIAALLAYGRRFVKDRLFRVINIICAVFMIYLAASLLWNTIQSL
ncbi:MAG TPA: LysE family transporter [Methanomassiliicoccales archaeon]